MYFLLFNFAHCCKVISIGMSGTKTSLLMEQLNDVEPVFTSKGDNFIEESDRSISPCPWNSLQNKNLRNKMLLWTLTAFLYCPIRLLKLIPFVNYHGS